jgi:hypothetical protein
MKTFTATASRKLESAISANYVLPATLAVNVVLLGVLESAGAVPAWLKSAAALFLAF